MSVVCMRGKRMALLILSAFLAVIVSANGDSRAQSEKANGAENIVIDGGQKGNIQFPHWMHQKNLSDCNICHSLFKQEPRAIEGLKAKGDLEKKQIMNSLCLKCHREENKKGNQSAPTACSACHKK
ncbi:putative cytochrome C3 [uncultured Desulfobacterium sp.]|uniref:Putative cytochrome C3 n=1 Tax=uncultured Desulfobacterium sp. TaxID=201089 RepID=A0A445MYT9_9BACT|nr:putative cytochrome C3 [uncultured Desulfobacterium sp.]